MQWNWYILKLYVYILQKEMLDVSEAVIHSHDGTFLLSIFDSHFCPLVLLSCVSLFLCLT